MRVLRVCCVGSHRGIALSGPIQRLCDLMVVKAERPPTFFNHEWSGCSVASTGMVRLSPDADCAVPKWASGRFVNGRPQPLMLQLSKSDVVERRAPRKFVRGVTPFRESLVQVRDLMSWLARQSAASDCIGSASAMAMWM
jgi:hypothetical protein